VYVIAIIRYMKPLEEVQKVTDEHRAYTRALKEKGVLVASGPFSPRIGGALLLRLPDEGHLAAALAVRDGDPFVKQGIAQYELLPWAPVIGKDDLDKA
jgi:uncharacterized protein YciI